MSALSMRRLATELGVSTMSLYRYVRNRSELLDGVCQRLAAETDLSVVAGESRAEFARKIERSFREVAHRHPNAFHLLALGPISRPPLLNHLTRILNAFISAGYSPEEAKRVWMILDAFTTGFASLEAEETKRRNEIESSGSSPEGYEELVANDVDELVTYLTSDTSFELGLQVILEGLKAVDGAGTADPD